MRKVPTATTANAEKEIIYPAALAEPRLANERAAAPLRASAAIAARSRVTRTSGLRLENTKRAIPQNPSTPNCTRTMVRARLVRVARNSGAILGSRLARMRSISDSGPVCRIDRWDSQDIVPRVDKQDFPGDVAGKIGGQPDGRAADVLGRDLATHGRDLGKFAI